MSTFEQPNSVKTISSFWRPLAIASMVLSLGLAAGLGYKYYMDSLCPLNCMVNDPREIKDRFRMIDTYKQGSWDEQNTETGDANDPTAVRRNIVNYRQTENIAVDCDDLLSIIKLIKTSDADDELVLLPAAYTREASDRYAATHNGNNVLGQTTVLFGIRTKQPAATDALVTTPASIQLYNVNTSLCPPPRMCGEVQ